MVVSMRVRACMWATVIAVLGVSASAAWACVSTFLLTTESSTVEPGGTVMVVGRGFAERAPIDIRLDSHTGPILATAPPPRTTMTSKFTLPVRIPEDTPKGPHLLVATQNYHDMNAGSPTRAMIHVGASVPVAPPTEVPRPAAVAFADGDGPSALTLVLVGLGVTAGALFLAGAASAGASRRRIQADTTHA